MATLALIDLNTIIVKATEVGIESILDEALNHTLVLDESDPENS